MKLDGKSVQAAMMHLVEEYRLDPYQVMEIMRTGIKSWFKKDLLFFFQNILIITWNQKTKSLSKLTQKKQIVIIKQKLKFYEKN